MLSMRFFIILYTRMHHEQYVYPPYMGLATSTNFFDVAGWAVRIEWWVSILLKFCSAAFNKKLAIRWPIEVE